MEKMKQAFVSCQTFIFHPLWSVEIKNISRMKILCEDDWKQVETQYSANIYV